MRSIVMPLLIGAACLRLSALPGRCAPVDGLPPPPPASDHPALDSPIALDERRDRSQYEDNQGQILKRVGHRMSDAPGLMQAEAQADGDMAIDYNLGRPSSRMLLAVA